MTTRWVIVALALVGCAARGIVEPAPHKVIVAKHEQLVVTIDMSYNSTSFTTDLATGHATERYWLVAADGTACPVGQAMWRSVYVGQVIACPYAWRPSSPWHKLEAGDE